MSPRIWLQAAFRNGIPRRSFIVALVVGPILTTINQGDRLVAGEGLNWYKVVLTFMVPYAVATVGALGARQSQNKKSANSTLKPACQPDAAPLRSAPNPSAETGAPPMKARVHVTLKSGVLDPQGKAIENALSALGFAGVENVRQGKVIEFSLDEGDPDKALASVEIMCEKLLANTVIENYAIDLES